MSSSATRHRVQQTIRLASRLWSTQFNTMMLHYGQSSLRWMALRLIADGDGHLNQRALSDSLRIDEPACARLVAALEAQGLLIRNNSSHDRRVKQLTVTAEAIEIIHAGEAIEDALSEFVFAGIDDEDLRVTEDVLKMMCDRIHSRMAPASSHPAPPSPRQEAIPTSGQSIGGEPQTTAHARFRI